MKLKQISKTLLYVTFTCLAITSCDDEDKPYPTALGAATSTAADLKGIFIAGNETKPGESRFFTWEYKYDQWWNTMGVTTDTVSLTSTNAQFIAGCTANNDTYMLASVDGIYKLYKNKTSEDLTFFAADETPVAIAVSNTEDVYIVGNKNTPTSKIICWKNGIGTEITNGTKEAKASSIKAHGTDIYITGYEVNVKKAAKVWKNNDAPIVLSDGTSKDAYVNNIIIGDTSFYAVGRMVRTGANYNGMAWSKGNNSAVKQDTIVKTQDSDLKNICFAGDSIYIIGKQYNTTNAVYQAKIWSYRNPINVKILSTTTVDAELYDILYTENKNLYITGIEKESITNKYRLCLWINGTKNYLTSGINDAKGGLIYYNK